MFILLRTSPGKSGLSVLTTSDIDKMIVIDDENVEIDVFWRLPTVRDEFATANSRQN